jgi:hypothetical protein
MSATVVISRTPGRLRDRYRAYEVIVNDQLRGELDRGDKESFEVSPCEVEIYLKINWCKSQLVRLDISSGTEVRLVCQPRNILTALYGITFGRNNYIQLDLA